MMGEFGQIVQAELKLVGRRLRGMAMVSRGIVPNLVIAQRVVDKITNAAKQFLADETGETMVGLVLEGTDHPEGMPTLYVLDTISPDESTIRRSHMFEQGDELQQDIFVWLLDNWQAYRDGNQKDMAGKFIADKWNVPLRHLGDWHKQPGFMIQPSGGDLMTALNIMADPENEFEFLLVPIVTLGHPPTTLINTDDPVNYFTVEMPDGTNLRMDWWYIHRDVRFFQPIHPVIIPDVELPTLTPYPWHILELDRLDDEVRLINDDGLFLIGETAILWEADGDLPLEICFMIAGKGLDKVFIIVTDWNYPRAAPRAYLAPFAGIDPSMYIYDIFEYLWQRAEKVDDPPGWKWSANSQLLDYIHAIEAHLGLRPDKPQRTATGGVKIEVEIEDRTNAKKADDDVTVTEEEAP